MTSTPRKYSCRTHLPDKSAITGDLLRCIPKTDVWGRNRGTRLASSNFPWSLPTDPRAAEQPGNGTRHAPERSQLVRLGCCPHRKIRSNEIVGLKFTDYIFVGHIAGERHADHDPIVLVLGWLTICLRFQISPPFSSKISQLPLSRVSSQLRPETLQRVRSTSLGNVARDSVFRCNRVPPPSERDFETTVRKRPEASNLDMSPPGSRCLTSKRPTMMMAWTINMNRSASVIPGFRLG